MMLSSLLFVLFETCVSVGTNQPCFLRCKDNYMNGMQDEMSETSSEWSVDMVTPLQTILSSRKNKGTLSTTLGNTCRLNDVYMDCLHKCDDGPAKRILTTGQKAWTIICDDFHNDTDFRGIVMPCWSDYGADISSKCSGLAAYLQAEVLKLMESGMQNIQETMSALCRSTHAYDKCFIWQNYEFCGVNAGKFLVKLTHQTSHALVELIGDTSDLKELPRPCKDWLNQKGMSAWHKSKSVRRGRNESHSFNLFIIYAVLGSILFI